MHRRSLVLLVAFLLWACSGQVSTTTSTDPALSPDWSQVTSTTEATATGSLEWPGVEVLVTSDSGVFLIDSAGQATQLVTGPVTYAVEDTRGGLLFQVERGRSSAWWGEGSRAKDTRVWWIQQGSGQARELLVPTPGMPLDLSLHDSFVDTDGHLTVLYVRHDSTMDPVAGPFVWVDSLRTFDIDTGDVTELLTWSGYEAGLGRASASTEVIAVELLDQVGMACGLIDPADGRQVAIPGSPDTAEGCEELECPWNCVVSNDGGRLAYETSTADARQVTVVPTAGPVRSTVVAFGTDRVGDLDVSAKHLLMNHPSGPDEAATLVDLETGARTRVPVAGLARFVSAPIDIATPVVSPEPGVVGLRSQGTWRQVDLPGARTVTGIAPVGAGFFAIGTDADGLAGWVSQAGLDWTRVDVVEPEDAGHCHAWHVYATGSRLLADVSCAPSEGASNTIARPMVSGNGWQWREGRDLLSTVEVEPGAWKVTAIRQIASDGETVLLHGFRGVGFDWNTFLSRYMAPSELDRILETEGWASLTYAEDGTAIVTIRSANELVFEARLDALGVTDALLQAAKKPEYHLWRSGPNLVFEDLGTTSDLGLPGLDEVVGSPSGFYALDNRWSEETGQVPDIRRSTDGSRWQRLPDPDASHPADLAGLDRFAGGILIQGHTANAPAIALQAFAPGTGWTSVPLPDGEEDLCHAAQTAAVGSSGLIAGWSSACEPGPHATQSPATIRRGDVSLRVDRMTPVGAATYEVRSATTDEVLLEVFDPDDGSILVDGDTVRFRDVDSGETLFAIGVDELLDEVCFKEPQRLWWSKSDQTAGWEDQPHITGSQSIAANGHMVVAVDSRPEHDRYLCQPLTDLFPELFIDPVPTVWVGWID
jgi:hypothetical protein